MGAQPARIHPDATIARLAERQDGVVARWQLTDEGVSARMIERRLAAGTLRAVHRGVYALAFRRLSRTATRRAAGLAIGADSAVSHADAGGEWDLGLLPTGSVSITVPGTGGRSRRRGIALHRAPLDQGDWVLRNGLRLTSPGRTLLDLAALLNARALERALDEAYYRHLVSRITLVETLERNAHRTGAPALRRALTDHELGSTRTETGLEETFLRAYRSHGHSPFRCQVPMAPYRVDFLFPLQGVIVEIDGPAHRTRRRKAQDAKRDAELARRGFPTVRVGYEEIEASVEAAVARVDRELAVPSS